MLPGVLWGAAVGFGLWVTLRGVVVSRRPLRVAMADLERPRWSTALPPGASWRGPLQRWALDLVARTRTGSDSIGQDLIVMDRALGDHALEKVAVGGVGFVLPIGVSTLVSIAGVGVSAGLTFLCAGALAVGGFVVPDLVLHAHAERRRREARLAIGAFIDLTTIILAGGGGVETALDAAASSGDGWAFEQIRSALARARLNRQSPWSALDRLGADLGVPELAELASSMTLAGESGAKVRRSLAAKAVSMRDHELAEAHAEAEAATERMAGPVVAMLIGFILLIGYPAAANVLAL